jgi:hypothetical protein
MDRATRPRVRRAASRISSTTAPCCDAATACEAPAIANVRGAPARSASKRWSAGRGVGFKVCCVRVTDKPAPFHAEPRKHDAVVVAAALHRDGAASGSVAVRRRMLIWLVIAWKVSLDGRCPSSVRLPGLSLVRGSGHWRLFGGVTELRGYQLRRWPGRQPFRAYFVIRVASTRPTTLWGAVAYLRASDSPARVSCDRRRGAPPRPRAAVRPLQLRGGACGV